MKRGLILLSVLALAGVANASVQQGDTELDLLASVSLQNGDGENGVDVDIWSLSTAIGYFFTDNIQVQAAVTGNWTKADVGGDIDVDVYGFGARMKYHFMPTNQWVPYVGGQLFYAVAEIDAGTSFTADGVMWGPLAGFRFELNAYNDFFVEYQYQIWDRSDFEDFLKDGHTLMAGLIHQFK